MSENPPAFQQLDEIINGGNQEAPLEVPLRTIPEPEDCQGEEILPSRLWRLTEAQLKNTLDEALGREYGALLGPLEDLETKGAFTNQADQLQLSAPQVMKALTAFESIADQLLNPDGGAADLLACARSSSEACVDRAISLYGEKLWRRPLQDEEVQSLKAIYSRYREAGADQSRGIHLMIRLMLQAPAFWYRFEIGSPGADRRALTDFELASLLSYTLWDGPPDGELRRLARSGDLRDDAVLKAQFARMLNDPKSSKGFMSFFDHWLGIHKVLTSPKDSALFGTDLTDDVRLDLRQESQHYIRHMILEQEADMGTFFASPETLINANLANFYGLESATTSQFTLTTDPQRAGLLTQGAFIVAQSGQKSTSMVHKGAFVFDQLLCAPLPPPPPDISSQMVHDGHQELTTRQKFEQLHSQGSCQGCHARLDPVGASFESFDPIGRFRTHEGSLPIDASGAIDGVDGANITFQNATDMMKKLADTDRFRTCFALKYFQYAMGKKAAERQSCETARFYQKFENESFKMKSIAAALLELESFKQRQHRGP